MRKIKRLRRRSVLLLEVMIAYVLIILCLLPLLAPHVQIFKAQNMFLEKMRLEHTANVLYGDIYTQLITNSIAWEIIGNFQPQPLGEEIVTKLNDGKKVPYTVSYQFKELDEKKNEQHTFFAYKMQLTIFFKKGSDTISFQYEVFIARKCGNLGFNLDSFENEKDS